MNYLHMTRFIFFDDSSKIIDKKLAWIDKSFVLL